LEVFLVESNFGGMARTNERGWQLAVYNPHGYFISRNLEFLQEENGNLYCTFNLNLVV
jgi:hypothetical protein